MPNYSVKAILPFVKLRQNDTIDMGPVRFCTAPKCREYLKGGLHANFEEYIKHSYGDIWARANVHDETKDISIKTIPLAEMTCIMLDEIKLAFVTEQQIGDLIFDSAHLLCFLSNLGAIRTRQFAIPNNLRPFLEIGKIDEGILEKKGNWGRQNWFNYVGKEAEILNLDAALLECFGKIISAKFAVVDSRWARRVIRALHYYNNMFLGRDYGSITVYGSLPEDVVFLSMAFESLFDVHFASPEKKYTLERIMRTIQSIFGIKYDAPQEVLNEWVREFYELRSRIVHGDEIPDQIFHGNVNIDIPYIKLGMKVFIAALICDLCSHTCIEAGLRQPEEEYINDFYIYLWSQSSLLSEIKNLLVDIREIAKENKDPIRKVIALHDLEKIYLSVYYDKDYDLEIKSGGEKEIKEITNQIVSMAEQTVNYKNKSLRVVDLDTIRVNNLSKTEELIDAIK